MKNRKTKKKKVFCFLCNLFINVQEKYLRLADALDLRSVCD